MFTHTILPKALMTAFVLSMTSLASAHNFPKPAAGRAAACVPVTTGARTAARFTPPSVVTTGASYRVAGAPRFGGGKHVPAVACTRPMANRVAGL